MKKNLLKSLVIFLLLPVLILVGCGNNKKLPAISISRYIQDNINITRYDLTDIDKNQTTSLLTEKKAKKKNLSKYIKFELNAEPVWMYKMFIQKITFYVYCNQTTESQMVIQLKMSDLATEDAIMASKTENVETETFVAQCSITPKAFKAIKCTYEINRAVVVATGSTITIDIENSLELYSSSMQNESTFEWLIYGFKIHGESRTYTRN